MGWMPCGQPASLCRRVGAVANGNNSARPPLRLPLGTDTLRTIRDKHAFVERETQAWQALAASTDFPDAA